METTGKPTSKPPPYLGYVDYVDNAKISGWITSQLAGEPIALALLINEQVASTVRVSSAGMQGQGRRGGFELQYAGGAPALAEGNGQVAVLDDSGRPIFTVPWYPTAEVYLRVAMTMADARANLRSPEAAKQTDGDEKVSPAFILGAARSGTSILQTALFATKRYAGFPEGHVLPLAHELLKTVGNYYKENVARKGEPTMLAAIDEHYWHKALRDLFRRVYANAFRKGNWADKTPDVDMIKSAPFVLSCWPQAKFIYARRRGMENIESRRRKFPKSPFSEHCRLWKESMQLWLDTRQHLQHHYMEVDQFDIVRRPDRIAAELASFLGLEPNEQGKLEWAFRNQHIEQTSTNPREVLSLENLNWSEAEKGIFLAECGPLMNSFGYSFDSHYYVSK